MLCSVFFRVQCALKVGSLLNLKSLAGHSRLVSQRETFLVGCVCIRQTFSQSLRDHLGSKTCKFINSMTCYCVSAIMWSIFWSKSRKQLQFLKKYVTATLPIFLLQKLSPAFSYWGTKGVFSHSHSRSLVPVTKTARHAHYWENQRLPFSLLTKQGPYLRDLRRK